jgi:hypothetical protein
MIDERPSNYLKVCNSNRIGSPYISYCYSVLTGVEKKAKTFCPRKFPKISVYGDVCLS